MDFDLEEMIFNAFCFLLLLLAVIFILLLLLFAHNQLVDATLAEKALEECNEKGFDSYESYTYKPLSTDPYGVRCSHPRNEHKISINQSSGVIQ